MGACASCACAPVWSQAKFKSLGLFEKSGKDADRRPSIDVKTFIREKTGSAMEHYKKIGELGEGAYGDVWLARQRVCVGTAQEHLGRVVAVKRVRKPSPGSGLDEEGADSEHALEEMRNEVELMKALDHPSICKLFQVHEDAKNLYLVLEHIQGTELFEAITSAGFFDEQDSLPILHQLASALAYCHHRGVVHRDLKPENVMVSDSDGLRDSEQGTASMGTMSLSAFDDSLTVKLIDFGFGCRILHGVKLKARVGTFAYTAPEVLKGEECDEKQDLWSLGCLMYVVLSGVPPFHGTGSRNRVINGTYHAMEGKAWDSVSAEAKDLVSRLLTVSPEQRFDATQMLNHPWMTQHRKVLPLRRISTQVENLKRFHEQSLFQHICAGVMARQLDEKKLHKLHIAFSHMDKDGDGMISAEEFRKCYQELGDSAEAAEAIFDSVDMDQNGSIDYTEFIAACIDHKIEDQESVCWAAFQVFDKNGDGVVTFDELRQVVDMATIQAHFPCADLEQIYTDLAGDQDGHGVLDFDHFLAAVRGVKGSKITSGVDCRSPPRPKTSSALPIQNRSRENEKVENGEKGFLNQGTSIDDGQVNLSLGLPVQRSANETKETQPSPGLPIQSRLPIQKRVQIKDDEEHEVRAKAPPLPIKSKAQLLSLPIPDRHKSTASAMGLPIQSRSILKKPSSKSLSPHDVKEAS